MPKRRPVELRILDWNEIYIDMSRRSSAIGGAVHGLRHSFLQQRLPAGNIIPE